MGVAVFGVRPTLFEGEGDGVVSGVGYGLIDAVAWARPPNLAAK